MSRLDGWQEGNWGTRSKLRSFAIPVRTNLGIIFVSSVLYVVLLYAGSRADSLWGFN